jgi:hypothetical protein
MSYTPDDRSGMQDFVAMQQQKQASQDQFLHDIDQRREDNNRRVVESTALIAAGLATYNVFKNHQAGEQPVYYRHGASGTPAQWIIAIAVIAFVLFAIFS